MLVGAPSEDIGADNTGAAYLFSTNGNLITTFTNPTPAVGDRFGVSVAALGSDRVLIGAQFNDTGANDAGAAYLFNTNGTLITTFTNPTPSASDYFGYALTAIGSELVLIGAFQDSTGASTAGAAYLFRTNGALLSTITNPTPSLGRFFGISVAAVGNDRFIVGAIRDSSSGAFSAGSAYIYATNGALLVSIPNPFPSPNDFFGNAVATVGLDKILVGAITDDIGANDAGAAYLFTTNGALITTITNPTPAISDNFGVAVAALGTDRVVVGAYLDDIQQKVDIGSVHVFGIPYPQLRITRESSSLLIRWSTPETGLKLQQSGALESSTAWSNAIETVSISGPTNQVQLTVGLGDTNRFFRLRRQ